MKEYNTYFGKRFYKDKKGYFVNSMPIHAQRWVWINHHGTIPPDLDVHHKDGDKGNNDISNLELLTRSNHLKTHHKTGGFDADKRLLQLAEARTWLKTPEGRKKQAINTKNSWKGRKLNPYEKSCLGCGELFNTYQKWAKCCHINCYAKWRRKNKIGFIDKKCWICGKPYNTERHSRVRTCGKECGIKLQFLNKNPPIASSQSP